MKGICARCLACEFAGCDRDVSLPDVRDHAGCWITPSHDLCELLAGG